MSYELHLGDCLEKMKDIPDGSVDMVLADPPYGTTACKWDTVIDLPLMWAQLKRIIKPNGAIVMFAGQPFTSALIMSNPKWFRYCWVWEKKCPTGFANAKKQPLRNVEDIAVFYDKRTQYNPQGLVEVNRKRVNNKCKEEGFVNEKSTLASGSEYTQTHTGYPRQILKFASERGFHRTQKPVALLEYLINTYTRPGDTVLDFTMGSGSTGVAAGNLGRKFIGIEMDPGYFDIARSRVSVAYKQTEDSVA